MKQEKKMYRAERLKSRKAIEGLFSGASPSFGQYPLRLVYQKAEAARAGFPVQAAFSVPKRKFKRATDRNHIRRKVREAWRKHKHRLYLKLEEGEAYDFMILYTAKEPAPFDEIERAVNIMIKRFLKYRKPGNRDPKA